MNRRSLLSLIPASLLAALVPWEDRAAGKRPVCQPKVVSQLPGRERLNIHLTNASGHPTNAAEVTYAIYDYTLGHLREVLVGPQRRIPVNPSVGEYVADFVIPLNSNLGAHRIRWTMCEKLGGPLQSVVQEFFVLPRSWLGNPRPNGQKQYLAMRSLGIPLKIVI